MTVSPRPCLIIAALVLGSSTAIAESGPVNFHLEPGAAFAFPASGYRGAGFAGALKVDVPVFGPLAVQGQGLVTSLPRSVRAANIFGAGVGLRLRLLDDHKGPRFGSAGAGNWFGNVWLDGGLLFTGTRSLDRLGFDVGLGVELSLIEGLQVGPFVKFTHADALSMAIAGLSISLGADRKDAPADTDKDGIMDPSDKCPTEPEDKDGFEDQDGCPDLDNDKDGIPDAQDKCPNDAEDKDGFEDEDGCPDLDNDKDGIPDSVDRCPLEPETYNGIDDEDGCPEKEAKVFVTKDEVVITDRIFFAFNKATIEQRSHGLLKSVADVFKQFPALKKVRVDGHTDDVGTDEKNQTLSEQRAKAVMDFLIKAGVEKERLESKGFGKSQPLDAGKTEEARNKNRRVEFQILEPQGGIIETQHKVEPGQQAPAGALETPVAPAVDGGVDGGTSTPAK